MRVKKRNGSQVEFDANKIQKAVQKAIDATKQHYKYGLLNANQISTLVATSIYPIARDWINIEEIQDMVVKALMDADTNIKECTIAYITYRERHQVARNDEEVMIHSIKSVDEYIERNDWRVNANANQGYSLGGLILNASGKISANYWLSKVFSQKANNFHRNGDFHIHDLDMLGGYCAGWSLKQLLFEGFNGVNSSAEAKPPKHLHSAVGQMVNFIGTLQNEWSGAQAFSSVDTLLAPYVRIDNLSRKQVNQTMQQLFYQLGANSRWGAQPPFSNVTLDGVIPDDMKEQIPYIGGKEMPFSYGELQSESNMIQEEFMKVLLGGDSKGNPFVFPIPTINITKDFDWDSPASDLIFEVTKKYGSCYFQNFVNSELSPKDVRSMCCRLQLRLDELEKRGGGLFGSSEMTGSIGVVTINCARLGLLESIETIYTRLDELLNEAKEVLEQRRKHVQKWMDAGLYPWTKRYLGTLKNHFSTIGVNGLNEMVRNFSRDNIDITSEYGKAMAEAMLQYIRKTIKRFQQETGHMYNLEATPAEGTTYRFAREDKKRNPYILQAGTPEQPYYTNSSMPPTDWTDDPFTFLDHQESLQVLYTGGTVAHIYVNEAMTASACKELIKKVMYSYKVPYVTITPIFSICPKCGYISGQHEICPKCGGSDLETWTRVMGYHRPVARFNTGKKGEFAERLPFEFMD